MHLQYAPATCTRAAVPLCLLPCVPSHTGAVPPDCMFCSSSIAMQRSCGDLAASCWARCRGQTFFFFFFEMGSGIPIWLGVMGAAGSASLSLPLSSHFRPSPKSSSSSSSSDDGAREEGERPRPRPHLAGPRAHFVMLTNRMTVHAAIHTPPGWPLLGADHRSKSKSTTTVSSQLGRSLA